MSIGSTISGAIEKRFVHVPRPDRTFEQFWNEVKETTGLTHPLTQDEFIDYAEKKLKDKQHARASLGDETCDIFQTHFPDALTKFEKLARQLLKVTVTFDRPRHIAAVAKALEQHQIDIKKDLQRNTANRSGGDPKLQKETEQRLYQSLTQAKQLAEEGKNLAFQDTAVTTANEIYFLQHYPRIFGTNPEAMQKAHAVIDLHRYFNETGRKIQDKVDNLSALQHDIAEAPGCGFKARHKLKKKFQRRASELKTLLERNSKVLGVQKAALGPEMLFYVESLKDVGLTPLTALATKAIREGNVETINMLLKAGADPVAVGLELASRKTGFLIPNA